MKQLLTSVVREICMLRSVGAGERATAPGHPVAPAMVSLPRSPVTTMPIREMAAVEQTRINQLVYS